MTASFPLTVNRSLFTIRYLFAVDKWLMANGKCMVNGRWLMVNGRPEAV